MTSSVRVVILGASCARLACGDDEGQRVASAPSVEDSVESPEEAPEPPEPVPLEETEGTTEESERRDRLVLPPTEVRGLRGAVEVTTGDRFACARVASGHVACWGDNTEGQLGVAGLERALEPEWLDFPE